MNHAAGALRLACHGRGCEKYCWWWQPRSARRDAMVRWGKRLVARARRSVSAQGLITARTARAAPRSRATRRGGFEQPLLCLSARPGPRVAPDPGAGLLRTGDPSPLRDGSLSCLTGSRIQGSIPNHGDRRTRPPRFSPACKRMRVWAAAIRASCTARGASSSTPSGISRCRTSDPPHGLIFASLGPSVRSATTDPHWLQKLLKQEFTGRHRLELAHGSASISGSP